MQRLLTWHNLLTRATPTALAVLLLAGAPAAPAAAIELIGTGTVPGTATDSLGATPSTATTLNGDNPWRVAGSWALTP